MIIKSEKIGKMGEDAFIIVGDAKRFQATISKVGATLVDLKVNNQSVVLGYPEIGDYLSDGGNYLGAIVGRYANRIYKGVYNLQDGPHTLTVNNCGNANHSSISSFHRKTYKESLLKAKDGNVYVVELLLFDDHSRTNEYPGDLEVTVKYTLNVDELTLDMEYRAELINGDATPINMTNHTYFNLNKAKGSSITGTAVKLCSNKSLEVSDGALIPTGKIIERNVSTFASDHPTVLGSEGPHYDNCFVVDENKDLHTTDSVSVNSLAHIFTAYHPESKISLDVSTTEPSFVFYTGDNLFGEFEPRSGFCVEQGRYIDAINRDEWRDCVLLKQGEVYTTKTQYRFKFNQ